MICIKKRLKDPLSLVAGIIVATWALTPLAISYISSEPGIFGDQFGSINALFSGMAFLGVIYAIVLQKEELQLQRKELILTRSELAGQREIMDSQRNILEKQSFETTFFQLMRMHNEIVNAIDLRDRSTGAVKQSGRDCFGEFYKKFLRGYKNQLISGVDLTPELINSSYLNSYKSLESELGHYFRSLYNIIKYIDSSEIENKRLYANLARAQLSSNELALLFYNCLSDLGRLKFKPLVEKYSLLKMVPKHELVNPDIEITYYEPSAFRGET